MKGKERLKVPSECFLVTQMKTNNVLFYMELYYVFHGTFESETTVFQ